MPIHVSMFGMMFNERHSLLDSFPGPQSTVLLGMRRDEIPSRSSICSDRSCGTPKFQRGKVHSRRRRFEDAAPSFLRWVGV